ncbi:MAG: ATP-binding cassette domain-containing protein, partial [Bacteroidales bacterium]|nr:ATP-binding cassette domain-containing protein [Bacteroidales bacterium]
LENTNRIMIEINNITKIYDGQRAVDNVSFSVGKGEVVGLLGPNGAGKSTLMKILTCFIPPTEGEATICGHSIYDDPLAVRRQIGYLPEHNPLYLDMYVREFLQFAAGIYGIKSKDRVEEMIELVGLTPECNKRIGQLSKGYRQRVGLAQAMIHDPQVLILDEPTTGLDPNQLEEIRTVIKNAGKNKVVLLSTHIMQEVEAMCSRAIIINHGKLVSDDILGNITSQQLTEKFHKVTI